MHTVRGLIAALAGGSGDLPVAAVIVERVGWYAEHTTAGVDHLDVTLDDTGDPVQVWLIAAAPTVAAPAILRIDCRCGTSIIVDDTNP